MLQLTGCLDSGVVVCSETGVICPPGSMCNEDGTSCLLPTLCGNGSLEGNEVCDDGNMRPGDGCSADCLSDETCANGIVDVAESCDDSNLRSHDGCSAACQLEQPTWTRAEATGPTARGLHSMAYDAANARVVLFGGIDDTNSIKNDTWLWDGETWSQPRSTPSKPAVRAAASMVYDAGRGRIVLFGGSQLLFSPMSFDDTWEWDGSQWNETTTSTHPSARFQATMAYDPGRGEVVLFGGATGDVSSPSVNYLGDTWVYDGVDWVEKTPSISPPNRAGAEAFYDPKRDAILIHGGIDLGNESSVYNDTWAWDGAGWERVDTPTLSPARSLHRIAFDDALGRAILVGGTDREASFDEVRDARDEVWEWRDDHWTLVSLAPLKAVGHDLAYDQENEQVVLFGGYRTEAGVPFISGDTFLFRYE